MQIRLNHGVLNYDPEKSLTRPGGFATEFEGTGADGEPVAVKQLEIDAVVGIDR